MPRQSKKFEIEQSRINRKKLIYSSSVLIALIVLILVVNPDGADTTSILLFSFLFSGIVTSFVVMLTTVLTMNKFLHDTFFSVFFRYGSKYASRSARAKNEYKKIQEHEASYGVRNTDKVTIIYLFCIVTGFILFITTVNDPYFDTYLPHFVIGFLVSFFVYIFLIAPRVGRK